MLYVPRSTYYQSKHQTESKWKYENEQLLKRIKEIYFESKRRYGAIKIHCQLIKAGLSVSLKRIQILMKSSGFASIIQKKYPPYKQSKELVLERENILEQEFSTTSINQKLVSDITYIYVQKEGWYNRKRIHGTINYLTPEECEQLARQVA